MQRKVQVWVLVAWLTVCFMVVATIWAQRPGVEEQPTGKQGALLNRLARFSSRKAVVFLDLTGKRLGDEDVETIATFADLRELDLSETNIRDDQLPALAKLRNLQTLRLNKTHLTSAVIPHLEAIHWLNWLEITGDEFPDRLVIGELHRRGKGIYLRERSWDETNRIHSVSVPLGRLLLVRHGNLRMAVKFTKVTKKAQGGAEYVCYWQPAPEGDFASSSLQTVTGEVFEKYRYDPRKEGGQWAINDGGHLFVNIGAIKLEWSSDTIVVLV